MRVDQVSYGVAVASAIVCFVGVGLGIHTMAITGAVGTAAFAAFGKLKDSYDHNKAKLEYLKIAPPERALPFLTLDDAVIAGQAAEEANAKKEGRKPVAFGWRDTIEAVKLLIAQNKN